CDLDREHGGVGACASVLYDADRLSAERRGEQLQTFGRLRQRYDRFGPSVRIDAYAHPRRRGAVAVLPRRALSSVATGNRKPLLGRTAGDRPETERRRGKSET